MINNLSSQNHIYFIKYHMLLAYFFACKYVFIDIELVIFKSDLILKHSEIYQILSEFIAVEAPSQNDSIFVYLEHVKISEKMFRIYLIKFLMTAL